MPHTEEEVEVLGCQECSHMVVLKELVVPFQVLWPTDAIIRLLWPTGPVTVDQSIHHPSRLRAVVLVGHKNSPMLHLPGMSPASVGRYAIEYTDSHVASFEPPVVSYQ